MNHQTFPLQQEERRAIEKAILAHKESGVDEIRRHFARRRNDEFPGWQEKYERDVLHWIKLQSSTKP